VGEAVVTVTTEAVAATEALIGAHLGGEAKGSSPGNSPIIISEKVKRLKIPLLYIKFFLFII
jgi:hypothetical protein